MVTLKKMNKESFRKYIKSAIEDYANEKVASGNWEKEEAIHLSKESFTNLLPEEEETEFNYLFSIFNAQQIVGMIWIAQGSPNNTEKGFIYDFIIFEEYRGRGFGKEAMKALEGIAKGLGMGKIGLHVFGHNKIAQGLYEKMGYKITNISMEKLI